jgi:TfoX/Sxy family transcriptional regulator of competence genes
MGFDEDLVERIRAALKNVRGSHERRMFGGVCFTIYGNMACGVVSGDLMVRVGSDEYERALKQPHARPMDFTGRPMNGFVFVAGSGIKTEASLKKWVRAGVDQATKLPAKSPKGQHR